VPDDDAVVEECPAETQTDKSFGDMAAQSAECVSDSVGTTDVPEQSCVNSQDNT